MKYGYLSNTNAFSSLSLISNPVNLAKKADLLHFFCKLVVLLYVSKLFIQMSEVWVPFFLMVNLGIYWYYCLLQPFYLGLFSLFLSWRLFDLSNFCFLCRTTNFYLCSDFGGWICHNFQCFLHQKVLSLSICVLTLNRMYSPSVRIYIFRCYMYLDDWIFFPSYILGRGIIYSYIFD